MLALSAQRTERRLPLFHEIRRNVLNTRENFAMNMLSLEL
jgi:hypothetical protein